MSQLEDGKTADDAMVHGTRAPPKGRRRAEKLSKEELALDDDIGSETQERIGM